MSTLTTLPPDLYSPDQLSSITLELRAYINKLRDSAVRAQAQQKRQPALPPISGLLESLLEDATSNKGTPEQLLAELETMLNKAPVVHLILSTIPGQTFKRQITTWFRREVSPQVLLTFAARSDIGGGMVVQVGAHLYDFSFKQALLKNKHRLGELVGSVRQ